MKDDEASAGRSASSAAEQEAWAIAQRERDQIAALGALTNSSQRQPLQVKDDKASEGGSTSSAAELEASAIAQREPDQIAALAALIDSLAVTAAETQASAKPISSVRRRPGRLSRR